ncbi:MAG TPA: ABC transporter permease [Gemmatimonadales bacterium]|nr:ABC transporter permease [Gemmatimonadales bacterium]
MDRELTMNTLFHDARYAVRSLAHRPGFTGLAILTLALAIGPTTAVYSFVEGVLLRPLPYKDAGRLVRISWTWKKYETAVRFAATPSLAEVRAWMAESHSFDGMSPHWSHNPVLTELGEAKRVSVSTVKSNLLPDLAVGDVRGALLLALGAVGLVLLIACANVANLTLVRTVARGRETAIRTALGASRMRVVRLVMTEALLLALAGAAVGVLLAAWGVPLLVSLASRSLPRLQNVGINLNVLATAVGAALLTGLLFGLVPALQSARGISPVALKEGGAGVGTGTVRGRAGGAFVIAQVALTLMLLVGAGLLGRSFVKLMTLDPGFDPEHALIAQVNLPAARYETTAQKLAFAQVVTDRARALPGVTAAAISTGTPLAVGAIGTITVPGQPAQSETPWASFTAATPNFFRALSIPLRRGRLFVPGDGGAARPVIVNEALVNAFFPGQDPIGRQVAFFGGQRIGTIIGVVGNTREMSLPAAPPPVIYEPLTDDPQSFLKVIVRTAGDPVAVATPLRAVLRTLDPALPVDELQPMRQMMAESVATQRFYGLLAAICAGACAPHGGRGPLRAHQLRRRPAHPRVGCAHRVGRGHRPGAAAHRGPRRGAGHSWNRAGCWGCNRHDPRPQELPVRSHGD